MQNGKPKVNKPGLRRLENLPCNERRMHVLMKSNLRKAEIVNYISTCMPHLQESSQALNKKTIQQLKNMILTNVIKQDNAYNRSGIIRNKVLEASRVALPSGNLNKTSPQRNGQKGLRGAKVLNASRVALPSNSNNNKNSNNNTNPLFQHMNHIYHYNGDANIKKEYKQFLTAARTILSKSIEVIHAAPGQFLSIDTRNALKMKQHALEEQLRRVNASLQLEDLHIMRNALDDLKTEKHASYADLTNLLLYVKECSQIAKRMIYISRHVQDGIRNMDAKSILTHDIKNIGSTINAVFRSAVELLKGNPSHMPRVKQYLNDLKTDFGLFSNLAGRH